MKFTTNYSNAQKIEREFLKRFTELSLKGKVGLNDIDFAKHVEDVPPDYLRVSSISGGCMRKDYYKKKNFPNHTKTDLISELRMLFGDMLHSFLQYVYGDFLSNVEERFFNHDLKITGATDGFIPSMNAIIDFKTAGCTSFLNKVSLNKAKKDHTAQVHWYMYLYNKKYGGNCQDAFVMYLNRNISMDFNKWDGFDFSFSNEQKTSYLADKMPEMIKIYHVKYDEEVMENELKKVDYFWDKFEKEKLPRKTTTTYYCDSCPYLEVCKG